MDWSTRRVVDLMEMSLMSDGTLSPTSVHTTHREREMHKKRYFINFLTLVFWPYIFFKVLHDKQLHINLTAALKQDGGWGGEQG